MKSADYREYEKQFEKLNNKKLLPESALKNEEKIKINPNFIPPPLEGEGARSAGEGYTDAFDYSLRKESLQTGTARHARTLGGSQNIETNPSPLTPLPQGERGNTSTALPQGARGNISTALPQGETIFAACSLSSVISDETQMQTIKENKELLNENIKKHREVEDMVQDLAGYTIINCDCCTKLKIPPVYKNQIIICPHCGKKHVLPAE